MKTKLFTLLLAVAASVGTIYASYKKVNGIWYEFDSSTKTATVTYEGSDYDSYSNEYTGSVVIPASVTYNDEEYSVTSIGERAFSGCTGLTSLTIGNSVTSIGIGAFSSCRGLTSVTIGNSVTSIGDYAFYNCSGLTSVHISDIAAWCAISFASSDANPLHYARNLYFNDELITNLVIPDNVTSIGDGAFRNCRSLTSVTIPNSVTSIGNDAFYNCSGLTSVHISDIAAWCAISFASSDANPLYYAHNLYLKEKLVTDLVIPNSVTSIWNNAFYNCSCLTSVTIGNSVTSIGSSAFHQCTSLKIVINNSALDIVKGSTNYGYVAYYAIDVYKGRDVIDDFVFSKKDETDYVVVYTGSDSQVTLPANYRGGSYGVAAYLFYNNTTVKSITLSNSVTSIGDYAFNGCSNLNVVYIGNSVISIGQEAFRNCPQLYKIIMLPNSVPSGINDAFSTLSGRITYVGNTNYQSGYDVLGTQRIYPNLNSYFTVDGIVYALSNPSKRTCDIIDCDYSGATTEFTIGNTVVYRNVTLSVDSININAFRNNQEMTKLTVNNMAGIGDYAFANCDKLNNVIIDDSVKNIGNYAFQSCSSLENVTIQNKGNIGTQAFNGSSSQNPATYAISNVGSIGESAFANCTSIKSLKIDSCVTSIGQYAFQSCSSLENVTIQNKGNIGTQAFNGSSSQNPATYAISNVGSIGESAFANCTSMTNLTIDTCVTTIGQYAFQSCSSLEDVTIQNKGNIGTQAFNGSSTQNPATYIISNVGSIGTSAFANCTSITNLKIDSCVTTINSYAFQNCYGLEEVIIKNKGNIGTQAFNGSSTQNPATYIISNVGSIGALAFANCTSIKSLKIDSCVTSIGQYAFQSCSSLENVTIQNKGNIGTQAFNGSSTQNPATYIISNVGAIGESAFANCSKLQKAQLGNQIPSINQSAFSGCVLLDSITMPNTISSLGASAFNNCQQLAYVKLSNLLTSIGRSTFAGCSTLPELFIPKSVTSIGNGTFKGCSALSIVSFEDSSAPLSLGTNASNQGLFYDCHLDSLYIGRELNYPKTASDGYSPFYRNSSLRSIVISDFPTKVETNEFYGCTKLYSVYIGNGVQRIGDYAFSGCSSIDYFSFGNQVHTIGAEAFSDCVAMTRLYSYCQVPPTCGASALADIDKWNCTLYIPKGTASTYAAANQWMDFFFIEENEEGGEGIQYTISVDFDATKGTVTGAGVYNIGTEVILIATPAEGCTFVAWEDGSTNPERHIYAYKSETYTATFSAPNYELYNGNDIAVSGESTPKNIEIDRVSYPNAIAYSYSTTTDINLPDNICGQNNEGDWYADSIALIDAQPFYAPYDVEAKHLSYARTFENDQWQALYVPFDMQYADFSSKVRIAYVNNVHQYDDDDNGVIDRTVIEFISVVNDDIKANWPYIVKPNTAGAMTFNVANTTLHATEDNDVECQSAFTRFNIIGTYQNTPIINKYIVHNSEFELCESLQTVSPFRIYLVVTNKYPTSPQPAPMRVTFMIDGREEPAPTGVEMLYENDSTGETYDVLGRPVSHPSHGIFIRNGEKILVK